MIDIRLPIIKWIRNYAEYGKLSAPFEISRREISNLQKAGFSVLIISTAKEDNHYICIVDWSKPNGRLAERFFEIAQDAISISNS